MHIHLIVPTDDRNLQDLKWFFLGLRQQTLDPEHWSVWIAHRGQEDALAQILLPWRQRLGSQVRIQTLLFSPETQAGALINACLDKLRDEHSPCLTLILQPGFQPHRYLLEHHQRYHQQNPACIALGSSQYEPEQALSFWGMASQLEQLCFNFFPQASTQILPHSVSHLHNLSLPLDLWLPLNEDFASWRFCAWDLALRWWCRGQRLQARHDLRCCLMSPAGFEHMTQQWQSDCQQDLALYLALHPFPLVPWDLQDNVKDDVDSVHLMTLQAELNQTQHLPCVFIESDTSVEKALMQWRSSLRRFWRGLALQSLQPQAPSEPTAKSPLTICPYPWRRVDSSLVTDVYATDPLWQEWFERDLAACQALIKALPDACLGIGHLPEFSQSLPIPFAETPSLQTLLNSIEPQLVFLMNTEFPELLSAFLALNQSVQAGSLLVLAPVKSKAIQDLQRLILAHYNWIELDTLAQTVILCRIQA